MTLATFARPSSRQKRSPSIFARGTRLTSTGGKSLCSPPSEFTDFCFHFPSLTFPLQDDLQGADGPVEPGPVPLVQHPPSADLGSKHPTTSHPLLNDYTRLRLPRHRRLSHGNPELLEREPEADGQVLHAVHPGLAHQ